MAQPWEIEGQTRPAIWSDAEWDALGVLVTADAPWVKHAYAPQLFGLRGDAVLISGYAVETGARVAAPAPGDRIALRWPDREVELDESGTTLSRVVGPWADHPSILRRLLEDHTAGVVQQPVWGDGTVSVRLTTRVEAADPDEALDRVDQACRALEENLGGTVPGAGFDDMATQLARVGLPVPYLPLRFRKGLRSAGKWAWSTDPETMDRRGDYLLETGWMDTGCADHVALSLGPGGIGGSALSLRMAWGPLALLVQAPWGGFNDAAVDIGGLGALFYRVGRVVRAVEKRGDADRIGRPERSVVILGSSLRPGAQSFRYRSSAEGGWVDVEPDEKLFDQLAEVVRDIPLNP